MAFGDYWNELMGLVPELDATLAQKLVNRAWLDIQRAHKWSFNTVEGYLRTPALINTGSVTVTQGSTSVTGDATAIAAWNLIANAEFIQRQFRIGGGPVYNISTYTSPTITLERPYGEPDAAGANYEIYQCYYPIPEANFIRWTSFVDVVNGFPLETGWTKSQIDLADPKRGAKGLAYKVANFRVAPSASSGTTFTGAIQFELWPHPTSLLYYQTLYQRRGADFVTDDDLLPNAVCEGTLIDMSKIKAYEWAEANKGKHPTLKGVDWNTMKKDIEKTFKSELNEDIRNDLESFQSLTAGNYTYNYLRSLNFAGNWAVSHAPFYGIGY